MATTIKLEGEARSEFGKGVARRLRVANKIPATIYAGGEEPAFVTLPMRETTLALRHTNALFTIAFDGNAKMAVVKDVQKNPVKRIIEHVDFLEVKAGEKIDVEVPVFVEGTPKGAAVAFVDIQELKVRKSPSSPLRCRKMLLSPPPLRKLLLRLPTLLLRLPTPSESIASIANNSEHN